MSKEIEIQVLDVERDVILKKLKSEYGTGLTQEHALTRMVRSTYHTCNGQTRKVESFARVRKEHGDTTITVKVYDDPKFPSEYEIATKNSFDEARELMLALNLQEKAIQETYREKWHLPAAAGIKEVTFDLVPGLPMYMEVEATSETVINGFLDMLGVPADKKRTGAYSAMYAEYYDIPKSVIENETPLLTFADAGKLLKPQKNQAMLKRVLAQQHKLIGLTCKTTKSCNKTVKHRTKKHI
jgi:adenylate cyclase class IV